jgi:hypothetical protein
MFHRLARIWNKDGQLLSLLPTNLTPDWTGRYRAQSLPDDYMAGRRKCLGWAHRNVSAARGAESRRRDDVHQIPEPAPRTVALFAAAR